MFFYVFLIPLFSFGASSAEILVEATRLRDAPIASETTVQGKDLTQPSVVDSLRVLAGVDVIRQGATGQTASIFIRGARSEDTLVLIDGIEANDMMAPSAGYDFANLNASEIERIEIYRGPQTVRFGPRALGGVILITTREGKGPRQGYYRLEGGSFDTARASVGIFGGVDGSETLGYSLGLDGFQSHGFSAADKIYGNTEPDGAEIGTVSNKIAWRPDRLTAVTSTFRYIRNRVDLDRSGGTGGDDPNNTSMFRQALASVQGERRFGALKSDLGFFFNEAERSNSNPSDPASADNSTDYFLSEMAKLATHHEYTLDDQQTVILGLEWRSESGLSHSVFNSTVTDISRQTQTIGSEAIIYLYSGPVWFADIGLRSDQKSSGGSSPTGRASIGRKLGTDTTVQLSYGSGLKSPSLYQLYSSYGNTSLRSELSDSSDLQVDHKISDLSSLTFAIFANHFRDLISFDSIANQYFNIAAAETSGAEFQLRSRLTTDWSIVGRYTYMNTKDLSTGLKLTRRPQESWGYLLKFDKAGFESSLNYRFVGPRDDTDPVSFTRVVNPTYSVFDFIGSYRFAEHTKFTWRIENLQNQPYQEVYGYGTAGLSFYAGFAGEI